MGRTACTEPQCLYKGDLYLYLSQHNFDQTQNCYRTKYFDGNTGYISAVQYDYFYVLLIRRTEIQHVRFFIMLGVNYKLFVCD